MKSYHIELSTKTYSDTTIGLSDTCIHIGNFQTYEEFIERLELKTLNLIYININFIDKYALSRLSNKDRWEEYLINKEVGSLVWLFVAEYELKKELAIWLRNTNEFNVINLN
ncbi:MAG: hypothetical protein ACI9M3_000832 [Bacteroidia bacterium]|jgi:hypothetical protein